MPKDFLIEVSSEAGRKIGGIYTVLLSKSRYVSKAFPKRNLYIGMYDEKCARDVKFLHPPKDFKKVFDELSVDGIICHYGEWVYASETPIILIESKLFGERTITWTESDKRIDKQANYCKFLLWKYFKIDSLMERSYDFSENVVWGWAVGKLIEKLAKQTKLKKYSLIAQFHEWISGAALLYCKAKKVPVATVFTTHATVLGRSLSSLGIDVLEKSRKSKKPIEISEAYRLKVEGKHQLELQAAMNADVFTTVSDTVATEVKYILGKEPDIIVLNGMDFDQAEKETEIRHLSSYVRGELLQVIEACFIPYYEQRYDHSLITFISGRYEFYNKGFDTYIWAMGKLNERLKKKARNGRRVFAFILAPTSVKGPKISIIKNYLRLDKIHEVLEQTTEFDKKKYVNLQSHIKLVRGRLRQDINAMASGFVKDGPKPHINMFDLTYNNDRIIQECVKAGLTNSKDDIVKVLFYPTYVRPNDGLMSMGYYDMVSGMDVGIFPSRYEPFGYTPLEAGLKMNLAVSSDAAGFGQYMKKKLRTRGIPPVKILSVSGKPTQKAAEELADYLEHIYSLPDAKLKKLKQEAYRAMKVFDWKFLIKNYLNAYKLAKARYRGKGKRKSANRR